MERADRAGSSTLLILAKLLLFTVCVPGSVTVWLPLYAIYPWLRRQPLIWDGRTYGALVVILLGVAGYLWCALDFAFVGRGTPAPIDPPKVLVARGLYRFSRNPMYVSVLLILAGESILFWSRQLVIYAAAVAVVFHLFVLLYEEPTLRRKMGTAYEQYCSVTPRWLLKVSRRRRTYAI